MCAKLLTESNETSQRPPRLLARLEPAGPHARSKLLSCPASFAGTGGVAASLGLGRQRRPGKEVEIDKGQDDEGRHRRKQEDRDHCSWTGALSDGHRRLVRSINGFVVHCRRPPLARKEPAKRPPPGMVPRRAPAPL